jgi:hypothetical protein
MKATKKIAQAKDKPHNLQGEHPKDEKAEQKQDDFANQPHRFGNHPKPS